MNFKYICGGKTFSTEAAALQYASEVFIRDNIVLGVVKVQNNDEEMQNA